MILNKMKVLLIAFFTLALSMIYPIMIADAAVTCFYKSEYTSGMNKICIYDCAGSQAAITVGAAQLCPLNIRR